MKRYVQLQPLRNTNGFGYILIIETLQLRLLFSIIYRFTQRVQINYYRYLFLSGVNVWQCKHSDVCTYIRRVLTNCRILLVQVHNLWICFFSVHNIPLLTLYLCLLFKRLDLSIYLFYLFINHIIYNCHFILCHFNQYLIAGCDGPSSALHTAGELARCE